MLKILGSILVIAATTLYGIRRAESLKEQYVQMEYVRQIFSKVQSEIRYARNPLGDIFSYIGRDAREPYKTWLQELGKAMGRRDGGAFPEIWEKSIADNLRTCALPKAELCRLEELGGRLGLIDIEMQVKTLELYLEQLTEAMKEVRDGMRTKVRLCHCLGVMGGMFIVILLF